MFEKASKWINRNWWGLIVAYAIIFGTVYSFTWLIFESMNIRESISPTILTTSRIFYHVNLTLLVSAHITLLLDLLFRKKINWSSHFGEQSSSKDEPPIEGIESGIDLQFLDLDLTTPQDVIDNDNAYSIAVFQAEIDDEGNYSASYERRGIRIKAGLTTHIVLKTGAAYKVRFKNLNVKAYDVFHDRQLNVEPLDDSNFFVKKYRIELLQPIRKPEEFAIRWTFVWPRCVTHRRDYDMIDLKVFGGGLKKLIHKLIFSFEPKLPILYEIKLKDGKLSGEASEITPSLSHENGKYTLCYEINNPKCDCTVIVFSRPEYIED